MPPLPDEVRNQIEQIKNVLLEKTPAVLGVYLHGSICLDGFVPGRSDIDLLVLSDAAMDRAARGALLAQSSLVQRLLAFVQCKG